MSQPAANYLIATVGGGRGAATRDQRNDLGIGKKGGANSEAFHAFRRACGFSRTRAVLPRATVSARTSAHEPCEHKVYRGLGGRPQERLPLNGRRGPTRPSILWLGRAALHAVKPCRLWLLGWRDADASLCSGLLAAMPRRLGRRLERNSAGRCHCCAPECWRHRVSRCV